MFYYFLKGTGKHIKQTTFCLHLKTINSLKSEEHYNAIVVDFMYVAHLFYSGHLQPLPPHPSQFLDLEFFGVLKAVAGM